MKKPVPLEAKQAEMRERQRCKTCGLRLDRTGWGGCKCRKQAAKSEVAELLKLVRTAMKAPGFWEDRV